MFVCSVICKLQMFSMSWLWMQHLRIVFTDLCKLSRYTVCVFTYIKWLCDRFTLSLECKTLSIPACPVLICLNRMQRKAQKVQLNFSTMLASLCVLWHQRSGFAPSTVEEYKCRVILLCRTYCPYSRNCVWVDHFINTNQNNWVVVLIHIFSRQGLFTLSASCIKYVSM